MMDYDALAGQVCALGAYRARVIPTGDITLDRSFRDMCRMNTCGNYGKCWTCPPDAGDIDELMARVRSFGYILVYQTVSRLEDSYDFEGMMAAAQRHNALALRLRELFDTLPFEEKLQLGAGGCHVCPVCAKRTDEPCRHPELAMPSLETYGIHVSALAQAAGMNYINGTNTVTYFGGLLFRPDGA